jgi:NAD(P)-dependent dehydrogenase (short-subunit alcohol dehydrogenase family)
MSAIDAIHAALPAMIQQKWGRIILNTSTSAREPIEGLTLSNAYRPGLLVVLNENSLDHFGVKAAEITERKFIRIG